MQCEQIEDTLFSLNNLNQNNIKGMILYCLFQKHVMEDEIGAFDTFTKYLHFTYVFCLVCEGLRIQLVLTGNSWMILIISMDQIVILQ